jgi:hypothetical protein
VRSGQSGSACPDREQRVLFPSGQSYLVEPITPLAESSSHVHLMITPEQPVTDRDHFMERAGQHEHDNDQRKHCDDQSVVSFD